MRFRFLDFHHGRLGRLDYRPREILREAPLGCEPHTEDSIAKRCDANVRMARGQLNAVRQLLDTLYISDVLPSLCKSG